MASPRPGGSPGRDALENTASREELEQIDELMYTTQMRELRAIGSGSFGSAVLVEMVVSRERFVAKKIPLEHLTEEDKAKALSEAALLRSLRHDNITEYFGSFVSANTLHILMEYCSGGSLQQVMARRERNGETFDDEEVFDWFLQIAKALEHVHAALGLLALALRHLERLARALVLRLLLVQLLGQLVRPLLRLGQRGRLAALQLADLV